MYIYTIIYVRIYTDKVVVLMQDFYNFMLDSGMDPLSLTTSEETRKENRILKKYSRYLNDLRSANNVDEGDLDTLMNGVIKKKLKIIPKDLV